MKNIVLVGFMGTGKTVIGKALARNLGMEYVSTDDIIEKSEGISIRDIFADKGEAYFRDKEKDVVREISSSRGKVIDTGGGVVMDPENMETLKRNGVIVCLWADPEVILARTQRHGHRPLLLVDDPKRRIQELLEERKEAYRKADVHVDTTLGDITTAVDKIIKKTGTGKTMSLKLDNGLSGSGLWELLLNDLLQNAEAFIMITDSDGRIVFANKRYLEYFDVTSEDVMNRNWIDLIVPGELHEKVESIFTEMRGINTACQFEIPVKLRDSSKERYFCWISTLLRDKDRAYIMFAGQPDREMRNRLVGVRPATMEDMVDTIFASSIKSEPGTAKHSLRVTSFAVALARELGVVEPNIENLRFAALLHDIGKLAVDEKVLFKNGKLNEEEFAEIQKHPGWGVEMLKPVYFLEHVLPIMMSHHENYDGTGYPIGLKGDEIPYESRILAVADIYEALTADRPYRKAFSKEEAISIMEEAKGKKLDPELVDVFLGMIRRGELNGDVKWDGHAYKDAV